MSLKSLTMPQIHSHGPKSSHLFIFVQLSPSFVFCMMTTSLALMHPISKMHVQFTIENLTVNTGNYQISQIQTSRILIQPTKISEKIYHRYLIIRKQICNEHMSTFHMIFLPATANTISYCITVYVCKIFYPSICCVT